MVASMKLECVNFQESYKKYNLWDDGCHQLTKWMNPAAVSHVLMKIEHKLTNLIELLF